MDLRICLKKIIDEQPKTIDLNPSFLLFASKICGMIGTLANRANIYHKVQRSKRPHRVVLRETLAPRARMLPP